MTTLKLCKKLPISPLVTSFHKWSGNKQLLSFDELQKVKHNGAKGDSKSTHSGFDVETFKKDWLKHLVSSPEKTDTSTRVLHLPKDLLLSFTIAKDPRSTFNDDICAAQNLWVVPVLDTLPYGVSKEAPKPSSSEDAQQSFAINEQLPQMKFLPRAYSYLSKREFDLFENIRTGGAPKAQDMLGPFIDTKMDYKFIHGFIPVKFGEQLSGLNNYKLLVRRDMGDKIMQKLVAQLKEAWKALKQDIEADKDGIKGTIFNRKKKLTAHDVILDFGVKDSDLETVSVKADGIQLDSQDQKNGKRRSRKSKKAPLEAFRSYFGPLEDEKLANGNAARPTIFKIGELFKQIELFCQQKPQTSVSRDTVMSLEHLSEALRKNGSKRIDKNEQVIVHAIDNASFKAFMNVLVRLSLYCE